MKDESLASAHLAAKTLLPTPLFPLIKKVCLPSYKFPIALFKFLYTFSYLSMRICCFGTILPIKTTYIENPKTYAFYSINGNYNLKRNY